MRLSESTRCEDMAGGHRTWEEGHGLRLVERLLATEAGKGMTESPAPWSSGLAMLVHSPPEGHGVGEGKGLRRTPSL